MKPKPSAMDLAHETAHFLDGMLPASAPPETIAALLQDQPELRAQFEAAYDRASDGMSILGPSFADAEQAPGTETAPNSLIEIIVRDLVAQTMYWDEHSDEWMPAGSSSSTLDEMRDLTAYAQTLPDEIRPQLTGNALVRHLPEGGGSMLLMHLAQTQSTSNNRATRQRHYELFRQGLDILDLDELSYAMIAQNAASMGQWYPQLHSACRRFEGFRIPDTTLVRVPVQLLQLTRIDYSTINATTHAIINRWAQQVFGLSPAGDYFIKTGIASSKFDFRNARVRGEEIAELGDYLLYIHQQALAMAGPLSGRPTYGAGTTTEWVVRDFIPAAPETPTIYHGLPLRCEYRVFVDCDSNQVLQVVPYWDATTMKHRFSQMEDRHHPDNRHDMVTYLMAEPDLERQFRAHETRVIETVKGLLPHLDLAGQWSLDIMVDGDDLWAIDMAPAHTSYFFERVPQELRRPAAIEQWLPTSAAGSDEDRA